MRNVVRALLTCVALTLTLATASVAQDKGDSTKLLPGSTMAPSYCPNRIDKWYADGELPVGTPPWYKSPNAPYDCKQQNAVCSGGQAFNTAAESCQCAAGMVFESGVCHAPCSAGTAWNGSMCASICTGGQSWNGSQCACPSGQVFAGGVCGSPPTITGFSVSPSSVLIGSQNFAVSWSTSGSGPISLSMNCSGANAATYGLNPPSGGSGTLPATYPGSTSCVTTATSAWGSTNAGAPAVLASCPPGTGWNGSTCAVLASKPYCASIGQWYNSSTNACQALYSCPSSLWAWTNGPRIPLVEATPTAETPDGHPWCYYWGRGIAGGGSDGGDPWAAAFDRVVGKAVTYLALYQESLQFYGTAQQCTFVSGDSGGYYDCSAPYTQGIWYLASNSYKGLIPVYGAPTSPYSATLATIGGSKCAPPHPSGSTALTGYYQAWYGSDCQGHGDSTLNMNAGYPTGSFCAIDTVAGSPAANRGIARFQVGGTPTVGPQGPFYDDPFNGPSYPMRASYPTSFCQPGGSTTGTKAY